MSAMSGFLRTVLVPALISLALYVSLTYVVLPLIRRHRHRYHQYLPLTADLSQRTTSLRYKLQDALINFFIPSSVRGDRYGSGIVVDGSDAGVEDDVFDDEEGEGLVGFDIDQRRREALERRRSDIGEQDRRLSRDLEEGFRDDSDEEEGSHR